MSPINDVIVPDPLLIGCFCLWQTLDATLGIPQRRNRGGLTQQLPVPVTLNVTLVIHQVFLFCIPC